MNTTQFLFSAWVWNPWAMAGVILAPAGYLWRFGWSRRAWWMIAAAVVLVLTLMSPVAVLAQGYLFSAHMTQHILLLLVIPALALHSLPPTVQLPARMRRVLNPAVCWLCGIGAMWFWHVPALCDAAATSHSVWAMQTVSLLTLGTAFWWQLMAPAEQQRMHPLQGVLYLFTACLACTAMGIILTFSPITVCKAYVHPADPLGIASLIVGTWGMAPARDQQVGGLIMWVPMCMIYLGAIFVQLARWYGAPAETAMRAS